MAVNFFRYVTNKISTLVSSESIVLLIGCASVAFVAVSLLKDSDSSCNNKKKQAMMTRPFCPSGGVLGRLEAMIFFQSHDDAAHKQRVTFSLLLLLSSRRSSSNRLMPLDFS